MKQNILYGIAVAILLTGGFLLFKGEKTADYKNTSYVIGGTTVTLRNGISEAQATPDSATKVTTRYFGNEAKGDLNGDGIADLAFILTQNLGGTGTFYYVVGAIQNAEGGYEGTAGVFLGDRIAPQTTEIRDGKVTVNYADRKGDEGFATPPSVAKSIVLKLDIPTMQFGEVAQNFEGEADPSRMTLGMKTWSWIKALYNDGRETVPKQSGKFTITFGNDGKFTAKTDCNSTGGSYTASAGVISFSNIFSTKMYCEGSQETEFATLLQNTEGYHFTSKGELIFDLKSSSGSVVFR